MLVGVLAITAINFGCQDPRASIAPEGVEWRLMEVGGATIPPLPDGRRPSMMLDPAHNRASGFAGCNDYFAHYELSEAALTFGHIGATRRACPDAESDVETQFFAALGKTHSWAIAQDMLSLLDGGNVLARFTRNKGEEIKPDLESLTVSSTVYRQGPVTLSQGEFRTPAAPGSASEITIELTDKQAFGSLAGQPIGAVVAVTTLGGTGTFYELALLVKENGEWKNTDTVLLGDRVPVDALSIGEDHVSVTMAARAPNDPMCCPTLKVTKRYTMDDGRLVGPSP